MDVLRLLQSDRRVPVEHNDTHSLAASIFPEVPALMPGRVIRQGIYAVLRPAWLALAQIALLVRRAKVARVFQRPVTPAAVDTDPLLNLDSQAPRDVAGTGRVTLVGAGPGDAELLTLKAVRALRAADVILFDDLVSADVLAFAGSHARRLLVGKRGGRTSCRQEDINDMMVRLAKAGNHVVRLKSGDPMIFGRAGEEIAHLDLANIPVDVIPGITAASAMASQLGISLTHRDHAQSVRFITGHSRHGDLPTDLDWAGIADARTTTVFYMGGRTASRIGERLILEGLSQTVPALIVSDISRPTQREWHGTLGTVASGMAKIGYDAPVILAIGTALAARRLSFSAMWHSESYVRSTTGGAAISLPMVNSALTTKICNNPKIFTASTFDVDLIFR